MKARSESGFAAVIFLRRRLLDGIPVQVAQQVRYKVAMLTHLSIRDYTIVEHLEMEFRAGMTVITGETGAGKSIMLGALGLCLGDRADPDSVRAGAERSEISATFHPCEPARLWLRERDMEAGEECILRRSLQREGRSRAFINGRACTLQDCAHLGELLIDIHGQHAHHSLLRREVQRGQLDEFAGQSGAVRHLQQIGADWSSLRRKLEELSGSGSERNARAQLLSYQVEELDSLDLQAGLVEALEAEQKQLANAERILHTVQQALELSEQHESGARQLLRLVQEDFLQGEAINSIRELVDSAAIQLGESGLELQHLLDRVEVNPDQLRAVEGRLETLYSVARKHRVRAELLPETRQRLKRELDDLRAGDAHVEALQGQLGRIGGELPYCRRHAEQGQGQCRTGADQGSNEATGRSCHAAVPIRNRAQPARSSATQPARPGGCRVSYRRQPWPNAGSTGKDCLWWRIVPHQSGHSGGCRHCRRRAQYGIR